MTLRKTYIDKKTYEEFLDGTDRYGARFSNLLGDRSEIYYVKGQFYIEIKVTAVYGSESDKWANNFFNIILGKV